MPQTTKRKNKAGLTMLNKRQRYALKLTLAIIAIAIPTSWFIVQIFN